jgi:hypothetical protein
VRVAPVLVLSAAFASGAVAQLRPDTKIGTRIPVKPDEAPLQETREVMARFAACTVKLHPAEAAQYVLESKSWAQTDKKVRRIADSECMTDTAMEKNAIVALRLPGDTMRYALAEALVQRELKSFDAPLIQAAQPLAQVAVSESEFTPKPGKKYKPAELQKLEESLAAAKLRAAVTRYGECVVRTDPGNAYRLLNTKPSSPEEGTVFQQLMPAFAQCLEAGAEFKSNRTVLRGVLALNYYRLAHAPRVQPAAGAQK